MDDVTLEYQLTLDEYRRMRSGPSPKTNRVIVSIIVGYALVAVLGAITSHKYLAFIPIFAFALFCLFARTFGPRRYWKTHSGIQSPRTVTFTPEGIEATSQTMDIRYTWSHFSRTRETGEFFFLVPIESGAAIAVPKRALRSHEDEARMRSILESRAPVSSEDRLLRKGLAVWLWIFSAVVILTTIIYVEYRIR
jgi:hypothetical protein